MNTDTFQGQWSQFKGELKREWGKFTDDDLRACSRSLKNIPRLDEPP